MMRCSGDLDAISDAIEARYDAAVGASVVTRLLSQSAAGRMLKIAQALSPRDRLREMDEQMKQMTALCAQHSRAAFDARSALDGLYMAGSTAEDWLAITDYEACGAEHKRLAAEWEKLDFLGRQAFFASVRMNTYTVDWPWHDNFATADDGNQSHDHTTPDGICLDMLEWLLLSTEEAACHFAHTLRTILSPVCEARESFTAAGVLRVLIDKQENWYNALESRECSAAKDELAAVYAQHGSNA
jgi:hypothetical protein